MDVITFPVNRYTTSGLQILLHDVISLPDATPYDKIGLTIWKIKLRWMHSYWILRMLSIHPHMNSLKVNCSAMELVGK